ncbi:hypothetical protein NDU88_005802 [Pleurodeles waltl]|uniref:Uncharacterized protein n=1 Tax=Pleurodeles waltl TaxID=8319 RepID=A0AAV7W8U7_PLEWA|nr:hypothetical protein NDU88_005802 [Pleurodeles waltl]
MEKEHGVPEGAEERASDAEQGKRRRGTESGDPTAQDKNANRSSSLEEQCAAVPDAMAYHLQPSIFWLAGFLKLKKEEGDTYITSNTKTKPSTSAERSLDEVQGEICTLTKHVLAWLCLLKRKIKEEEDPLNGSMDSVVLI